MIRKFITVTSHGTIKILCGVGVNEMKPHFRIELVLILIQPYIHTLCIWLGRELSLLRPFWKILRFHQTSAIPKSTTYFLGEQAKFCSGSMYSPNIALFLIKFLLLFYKIC